MYRYSGMVYNGVVYNGARYAQPERRDWTTGRVLGVAFVAGFVLATARWFYVIGRK